MRAILFTLATLCVSVSIMAQTYSTRVMASDIATLQVNVSGQSYSFPVIELGSDQTIEITFDELSYEAKSYYYKIIHCDANWNQSSLSEMEYLRGFGTGTIDNYDYSINTTVNYINYYLQLPNDMLTLLVTGNYAVIIAEDNNFDAPVATACFSIYQPLTTITAKVLGATDKEINGRYQQLEIEVNYSGLQANDPRSDFKVVVVQNGRTDNKAIDITPTYLQRNTLIFKNNKNLIFEGGNSYRTIDFSSRYVYGNGIKKIDYDGQFYHVDVEPAQLRNNKAADLSPDADGAMVVNVQGSDYAHTEADYFWVHFSLPWSNPLPQGGVYLVGDFTHNRFDEMSRMEYEKGVFYKSLFLKQGGYNYQFVVKEKSNQSASLQGTEGSYWQTSNSYQIFVYYRPFGSFYDRLVGYRVIQ